METNVEISYRVSVGLYHLNDWDDLEGALEYVHEYAKDFGSMPHIDRVTTTTVFERLELDPIYEDNEESGLSYHG